MLTHARLVALEQATLKRKQSAGSAGDAETIKAKRRASTVAKDAKSQDLTKLRAKLLDSPEEARQPIQPPIDSPVSPAAPPTRTDDVPSPQPRRKAAAPPSPVNARPVARPVPRPAQCRIEWWRGYVKSEFYATVRMPDEREYVLRTSPTFRWSKSTPPPKDASQVAHAHQTLVDDLAADGWVVSGGGGGDDWWALELKRRSNEPIDPQEGAPWQPTPTSSA